LERAFRTTTPRLRPEILLGRHTAVDCDQHVELGRREVQQLPILLPGQACLTGRPAW